MALAPIASKADIRLRVLAIIEPHIPDGDFTVAEVGAMAYADLKTNHPALLQHYHDLLAEEEIKTLLRNRVNSSRLALARMARPEAFAAATREFEATGDPEAFSGLLETRWIIDRSNTRRKMREMTRGDCSFVAERHEDQVSHHQMRAAFWRALASRVGDRTVGDVFTEAQVAAIMASCAS